MLLQMLRFVDASENIASDSEAFTSCKGRKKKKEDDGELERRKEEVGKATVDAFQIKTCPRERRDGGMK